MQLPEAKVAPGLPGVFFAVLPLQQPPELTLLHADEKRIWDGLETESRRREWWAGRVAAKIALAALGASQIAVLKDERGLPALVGPNTEDLLVSITHGRRLCAAAAARAGQGTAGLGIDLIEPEDLARLRKLEARVLAPGELDHFADRELALAAAWAAREAVAKATATGMWAFAMSRVHLVSFDPAEEMLGVGVQGARLSKRTLDDGTLIVFAAADRDLVARAQSIARA